MSWGLLGTPSVLEPWLLLRVPFPESVSDEEHNDTPEWWLSLSWSSLSPELTLSLSDDEPSESELALSESEEESDDEDDEELEISEEDDPEKEDDEL